MKWLKARRKELRITQEELALLLQVNGIDVSRATISHWELGLKRPPIDDPRVVNALARSLKMSVPLILRLSGFDLDTAHTESGEMAAALVDSLPPEKQRLAIRLIEELARN